jgi:hypothetical protein
VIGVSARLWDELLWSWLTDLLWNVVIPWGRFYPIRKDFLAAVKTEAEGGNGGTQKFWEWTDEQVRPYL